jgi:alpha-1,3-fucosyltransferase
MILDKDLELLLAKKMKKIIWFSSNCNSRSKREKLVEKLQEHLPVDVYGKCGTFTCGKDKKECDQLLTGFMFYLSFENALCKDYVTEKLYRALNQFIIPIVFNLATMSRYAPPKSYIDANDFDTVEDLVAYLKHLMNNPAEYLEYFWWKQHYTITFDVPTFQYGFCELCMRLRDEKVQKSKNSVGNIKDWWENDVCTKDSHIKF